MYLIDVILPTYNERGNILVILELLKCKQYHIIIVDDSTDGTYDLINTYIIKRSINNITLVKGERSGIAGAYRRGYKYTQSDRVVIMDSDLSHDPRDIRKFLHFKEYDIVTGTRYMTSHIDFPDVNLCPCCPPDIFKGIQKGGLDWNFLRKLNSRGANLLAELLLNKSYDYTGSFRMYKREVLGEIFNNVHTGGFSFQMEALALYIKKYGSRCKIKEIPIVFVDRTEGESKISIRQHIIYILGLLRVLFVY